MLQTIMLGFTSRAAFGKNYKNQEKFISILIELLKVGTGFNTADFYPSIKWLQDISGLRTKLEKLHHEVDKLLDEIIDDHISTDNNNTSMHEDFVDVLLRVQNDGNYEITRINIKAVILDMFAAGTDTSVTTVDRTMAEMPKKPSALEKAQEEVRRVFSEKGYVDESNFDELKYLRAVIKESLRLHPPVPLLLPRLSREKCKIDGYEIPQNTEVIVNAWTIGRDPRYWEDAECFKAERFLDSSIDFNGNNFEYIPFGAGRRTCPGMSFGLANVELPLALFLYHFDWKLPNGMKHEELNMSEVYFGVAVRRELNMHVIPIVSKPV
ncbi:cytochrome P450 71D10-like [Lycium ferocissimum]|uniref:cytochrome P450 71D10-like n=1 Tax=Lycium ferocissimum TaxID=112874 RepID=UPI002815C2E2|nr:cytochrome P450 71D10-like [Lycium ferocissimum]